MSFVTWDRPHFKSGIPTRKTVKSKRQRDEAKVKKAVRAECVTRDGYCFAGNLGAPDCKGPSEWAHFAGHRRSQTRGMAPERRHSTHFSGMLCRKHHRQEERGDYRVVYHTANYADGRCSWEAA